MGGQRASALPSHTGTLVEAAMKSIMLVTPVFRRFELTRIMLEHRVETFKSAQALGVSCGCVVVGDAPNLAVAEGLGFDVIEAPNLLGSKYNDGHQFSVENGWGISFQVNSDQVFDPHLLLELSRSPDDKLIQTEWLTAVHGTGKKALSYKNYVWSMKAYPLQIMERNPRPCLEDAMRMCDSLVHLGVVQANGYHLGVHTVDTGPLETIQFESGFQVTPWSRNLKVASDFGVAEHPVPWGGIEDLHGRTFTLRMKEFYAL